MRKIFHVNGLPGVLVLAGFILLVGCAKNVDTSQESVGVGSTTPPIERVEPGISTPRVEDTDVSAAEGEDPSNATMIQDAFFDFDRSLIRGDAKKALEENAQWLRGNGDTKIQIEGHCDKRGTNEYNLALGERRAQAAKRFLVALGIDSSRISTISYGEERPFCQGSGEPCFQDNRRAHFVVK